MSFLRHAKILANIENLKVGKQSLFLLTRITFEIPENEPLAYENLDYFFHKRDVDKKNSKKEKGLKEEEWLIKLSTTDIAIN